MNIQNKPQLLTALILFLLTLLTGILLNKTAQRPYPIPLIAAHKILSIGSAVLVILFVFKQLNQTLPSNPPILFIIIALLALIGLIVTGALISANNSHPLLQPLHIITAGLFPLATLLTVINLLNPS